MNPADYIRKRYSETPGLSGYDLSQGSNIYDLVVRPLEMMFSDSIRQPDLYLIDEMNDFNKMPGLPIDVIRGVARRRGIEPSIASSSIAIISLHFSSPIDWVAKEGSTVSDGANYFTLEEEISISAKVLESMYSQETGLYIYPNIRMVCVDGARVAANSLGYMTDAPAELVKITHGAVSGGTVSDTAQGLVEKIRAKDMAHSASSASSIKTILSAYYPGVESVVVCPGDERMTRDMVYGFVPGVISPKLEETYAGKVRRNNQHVNSQAYLAIVPEAAIDSEFIVSDDAEATQGQYLSIIEGADSSLEFSTTDIMNEGFGQSSERIGNTSRLMATGVPPTRDIYVHDETKYEIGDYVNIGDRSSNQIVQSGVIESIEYEEMSDCTFLTAPPRFESPRDVFIPVVEGATVLVTDNSGDTHRIKVDRVSMEGGYQYLFIDYLMPEVLSGDTVTIRASRLKLYNNIYRGYTITENTYVDVVNSDGLYIGPGWVKSEHNMPIGVCISDNQAVVVRDELVMGTRFEGGEYNAVKQMFLRYGLSEVAQNIIDAISVNISFNDTSIEQPLVSTVTPEEVR